MMTCSTARMSFTNASTLVALTSVNVNKTCTLLMGNAKVFDHSQTKIPWKLRLCVGILFCSLRFVTLQLNLSLTYTSRLDIES